MVPATSSLRRSSDSNHFIGGTGYTGSNIVAEAAERGHEVVSYSRTPCDDPIPGVHYENASMLDEESCSEAVVRSDVVIATLSPRGDMAGQLPGVYARLARLADENGVRLGVIGGFSSLRVSPGGPRIIEGDDVPPAYYGEAAELAGILESVLLTSPDSLDWFYVSPPAVYGSYAPGESTGAYRIGDDVALVEDATPGQIPGADFARAIIDEIEQPRHHRAHFSVMS